VAYDPITGRFIPDPVVLGGTPFGQAGSTKAPKTPTAGEAASNRLQHKQMLILLQILI